ncbi:MAG: radical SAM protein, partial [Euryarchaeota archaeon]
MPSGQSSTVEHNQASHDGLRSSEALIGEGMDRCLSEPHPTSQVRYRGTALWTVTYVGMDLALKAKLQKQRYHIVGEHGGVKTCHWTKESLLRDRQCYKGKFYGIESHNCMQMSPVVDQCNLACTYCWREPHMDTLELTDQDPMELLYESVRAQRRLLSGFGGNPKVPREKWLDAQNPKHVAISLNGEPTLYTRLSEYMDLCHKHGMTTMLVTNGTLPKVIEKLDTLPTQLYVSVDAPNKEVFDAVCKPKWNTNAWDKFEETIDLLPSLDT